MDQIEIESLITKLDANEFAVKMMSNEFDQAAFDELVSLVIYFADRTKNDLYVNKEIYQRLHIALIVLYHAHARMSVARVTNPNAYSSAIDDALMELDHQVSMCLLVKSGGVVIQGGLF